MNAVAAKNGQVELAALKARLAEAEETLNALYNREVDALLVAGPLGDQVFTLRGAETPYRLFVEAMNEGALTVSPDGTILYSNQRFGEMVHCPLEHVTGSNWQRFFPAGEQRHVSVLLEKARSHGAKAEFNLSTPEGRNLPVQISARPFQLDDFHAIGVLVTDIAESKAAENALRAARDELEWRVEERTRELGQAREKLARHNADLEKRVQERTARLQESVEDLEAFSYSVSHDLRAPLRSMQSFSEILAEECAGKLSSEEMDYLRRIIASAARLDRLTLEVLSYSRTVRAEVSLHRVNLDTVVREVIEQYPELQPPAANVAVEGTLPMVLAHESLLTQCLSNLLINAVKFVRAGTVPCVRLLAQESDRRVRLWIEDNGIGIDPRNHERIFRMFERIAGTNEFTGVGIGLSIVKKAAQRMGGQVGVESELGRGSRFWIELQGAEA